MTSAPAARSASCSAGSRSRDGWRRGRPRARASCLTGLKASFMPRPAGRSGWVSTRATSCPAFNTASRASAANSGVPANTSLTERDSENGALVGTARGGPALGLLQFGQDAALLEPRKFFHEYLALQVIHLVLDAHRKQAVRLEAELPALAVERLDDDPLRPLHLLENAGDGQAAFLAFLLAAGGHDFGIDEDPQFVPRFREVNDNHLQMGVHLGRRQADAGRGVHGFGHVPDQSANFFIDFPHRRGHFVQALV